MNEKREDKLISQVERLSNSQLPQQKEQISPPEEHNILSPAEPLLGVNDPCEAASPEISPLPDPASSFLAEQVDLLA